ncbi:MAG: DUF3108 domain-containing protein [Steroidobacteraceae bacterium]
MPARTLCAVCLAISWPGLATAQPPEQAPAAAPPETSLARADAGIAPFSAKYVAEWKNITVGTSDLELRRDAEPGHYIYKWTISARGIFRLVYSNDVTQQSWFEVIDDHVRPLKYLAEQGSSRVIFDFDWAAGHARGFSEERPVDLVLKPGTQDLMSIQIQVMLGLKDGNLPKIFYIIDKDQIKDFIYAQEGPAVLKTAVGKFDAVIVSSRRAGNDRVLRMWFAPSLGYLPVQAERSRGGKLEFAMRIRSLGP